VKLSPSKLPKNGSSPVSCDLSIFVRGNGATFVPVWPDWLEFDGSEGAKSIQDALVIHTSR
jgi:hypothetical protein